MLLKLISVYADKLCICSVLHHIKYISSSGEPALLVKICSISGKSSDWEEGEGWEEQAKSLSSYIYNERERRGRLGETCSIENKCSTMLSRVVFSGLVSGKCLWGITEEEREKKHLYLKCDIYEQPAHIYVIKQTPCCILYREAQMTMSLADIPCTVALTPCVTKLWSILREAYDLYVLSSSLTEKPFSCCQKCTYRLALPFSCREAFPSLRAY